MQPVGPLVHVGNLLIVASAWLPAAVDWPVEPAEPGKGRFACCRRAASLAGHASPRQRCSRSFATAGRGSDVAAGGDGLADVLRRLAVQFSGAAAFAQRGNRRRDDAVGR